MKTDTFRKCQEKRQTMRCCSVFCFFIIYCERQSSIERESFKDLKNLLHNVHQNLSTIPVYFFSGLSLISVEIDNDNEIEVELWLLSLCIWTRVQTFLHQPRENKIYFPEQIFCIQWQSNHQRINHHRCILFIFVEFTWAKYVVHTYQIGSQVVVVRVLQELLQEGHEITKHIAMGPGQLGD